MCTVCAYIFYINRKWTSKIGRVRKQKLFGQSLCLDPTMTYADVILRCYVSAICLFICFFNEAFFFHPGVTTMTRTVFVSIRVSLVLKKLDEFPEDYGCHVINALCNHYISLMSCSVHSIFFMVFFLSFSCHFLIH